MSDTILVFETVGTWQITVALGVLGSAIFLARLGLRGFASAGRRYFLLGLRFLVLLALGLLLLGPALQHRILTPLKSRLVVLVDSSESMGIKEEGYSRSERVAAFVSEQQDNLEQLGSKYVLEAYTFSEKSRPVAFQSLGGDSSGERTDLVASLSELTGGGQAQESDLAAVVLISDGADTEHLAQLARDDPLPETVENLLGSLGAPVNTLLVGGQRDFKDLAVTHVAFDDFAFIRNAVEVEARLTSVGLEDVSVPVLLKQGDRNLATKVVTVPAEGTRNVTLRFVPDTVGKFVYQVVTPVLDGEMISENNSHSFATRIIRDKIRVLHVVGRPSWDQRFLREVLKRNPNIDLVSFYILRTTTDAPGVSEKELSLIPFPVPKLFGSELDTFDVVIFHNFNHGPYQVGYYLPQIADYVRGGGAFCMIGGDLSFGSGGYGLTSLEAILPVRLHGGSDWRVEDFRAQPSRTGSMHPVLDLGVPGIWDSLPALGSYNLVGSVLEDATSLLVHPFEKVGSTRAPILALREVERGRSAALLTDGSWRWNFIHAASGESPRYYHRFWNNLLRWLIRDPALHPVHFRSRKARYSLGEPIRLEIRQRGAPGGASEVAQLVLREAGGGKIVQRRQVKLEGPAQEVELPSPGTGAFVAEIEFPERGSLEGRQDALVVEGLGVERTRPAPRPDILKKLAKATNGRYSEMHESSLGDLEVNDQDRFRTEASHTRPIIERWWVLAFLIGVMAAEWWIRRRWGLS